MRVVSLLRYSTPTPFKPDLAFPLFSQFSRSGGLEIQLPWVSLVFLGQVPTVLIKIKRKVTGACVVHSKILLSLSVSVSVSLLSEATSLALHASVGAFPSRSDGRSPFWQFRFAPRAHSNGRLRLPDRSLGEGDDAGAGAAIDTVAVTTA